MARVRFPVDAFPSAISLVAMIPRCQRGGPSSILGWRTFCLSLVFSVKRVDQVLKVVRELTVAQLVERGTVKVICSHPQVDGSIPSGEIFLVAIFTLYSNVTTSKKDCLEWGSNPRLHRRIELKSTALDHSAIEAYTLKFACVPNKFVE